MTTTAGFAEPLPNPPPAQVEGHESPSSPILQPWKRKVQADIQHTNKLVDHLLNNVADCCVLFSSEGKKPSDPNIEGPPSGKDKNTIHVVIAEVIFSGNIVYSGQYAANQTRFRDSVSNRITDLQNKFRDYRNEFELTGAGIVPLNVGTAENLHAKVQKEFPWQLCLFPLPCNIPSTSAATGSGTGIPQYDYPPPPHPPPSQFAPHQFDLPHQSGQPGGVTGSHPQWNYNVPPQSTHPGGVPALQFNFPLPQNAQPGSASGSPQHWTFGLPPRGTYTGGVTGSLSTPQFNFAPPPQSAQASGSSGSPQRWNYDLSPQGAQSNTYSPGPPTLSDFPGMDNDDDNPLAGDMEDLRMDESVSRHDDDNIFSLDSPPKSKQGGNKRQQPPSSPTPSPPPFAAPQKPRTSTHDGCGSFKSHAGQLMACEGATNSTPSVASSKTSRSSLGRGRASRQGSSVQKSPTSQTSVLANPKGKDSVLKRVQSEIQEQVEMLNDDLESIHSEKKEHDFIHEERANERADAAIVHQRMKEAKETEICLHEADTKALEMERDLMRQKIEWAKLNAAAKSG
ncbi:hypothetical protein C8R48DRAFT_780604 [Suillus tomentosus]|nr:hypothetical protein C8R48DRAFT_780604 [Suillus tomentosus]